MKNLYTYKDFRVNENTQPYTVRHNRPWAPENYMARANNYKGVSSDPGILSKVGDFFQKMEDRLNSMAAAGKQLARDRRSARPPSNFNTGYEILYDLVSVIPAVIKRIVGGTNYDYKNILSDEKSEESLKFIRHTNDEFIKKDLPVIKNEQHLFQNIDDLYKKSNINPGENLLLDEIARNRANIFYQGKRNF
jgi:hypothetical protein